MKNLSPKIFTAFFFLGFLCTPQALFGRQPQLQTIAVEEDGSRVVYKLQCSEKVQFATIYNEEARQLRVFLYGVEMPADVSSIVNSSLRNIVEIQLRKESPPVLQVSIGFPKKLPYQVDSVNGTIRIIVSKTITPQVATEAPGEQVAKLTTRRQNPLLQKLSTGARINLDFRKADIGNVLRVLARQNGFNVVANDSVAGAITVSLKNVTIEQALESILRANGYKYIIENEVIVVKPIGGFDVYEMETRIFRLQYIDAHNVLEAIDDLKSSEGKAKVLTTSFHNRKDVYDVNEEATGGREDKYWLRSSVLLVTDFSANIEAIEKLVAELDRPVPQLMIEAKLVETAPRQTSTLGIDWSKSIAAELFSEALLPGGDAYRYSTQSPLPNKNRSITFGTLNTSQFNAVLNYLQENMSTRLVSNPRILAMDNEPSDISVGTKFPIPQITRGVGGQGDIVTFDYRDIDIKLRVIPHVIDSVTIAMYVNPIIEEVTGQVTVADNTAPITSRREVDTVIKVKDGDTIVIGGMIKEREVVIINKVWILGDIPLLGHLFRNKSTERQQTDLLIFITTKIVSQ